MRNPVALVLASALTAGVACAQPLPELDLDAQATTVSGLSSGAFMAVQLQLAFSSAISGAGIVAGGPFGCADGSLWRALYVCMDPFLVKASASKSLRTVRAMASDDEIDPIDGIANDRVYLFHGRSDDTVDRSSMDALKQMYLLLAVPDESIHYITSVDAGHGFVTEQGTVSCDRTRPDYLIDCDFDQAGDILKALYGDLQPAAAPREDNFLAFDQSLYTEGAAGMDETAFAYIPTDCSRGERCRLHIALHGCKQARERIGQDFARLTGYNDWAETNRIVVLYPQAARLSPPWYNWFAGNPNGCWDWWGYSGSDYLSREAPQMSAIARMATAVGADLAHE